jgi:tetratricopeptide (TPR) repeat protein/DNA-binding XRE family transcriptional regulator
MDRDQRRTPHLDFGQLLRQLRGAAGLTQEDLADRSGLSVDAVSMLERGRRRAPRSGTVALLAEALGLDPGQRTVLFSLAQSRATVAAPVPTETVAGPASQSLPLDGLPGPGPLPPGSRMPVPRNPLFVGRAAELSRMAAVLRGGGALAATGMGGLGKTQLAVEFVHRCGRYFTGGVFWLSFANPEEVPLQVAACGAAGFMELRGGFGDLRLEEQLALVRSAWQGTVPRLLVFDNCEDEALLARWRPPSGGSRVLVTSRRSSWDPALGVETLAVDAFSRAESLELLRGFRLDSDLYLAGIAQELGDLPLALHLAGSYLDRYREEVHPEGYLTALRGARLLEHASLLESDAIDPSVPTRRLQGVARSFVLSYDRLDRRDDVDRVATALLERAAWFAPGETFARELLLRTFVPGAGVEGNLRCADALARLRTLGLLDRSADGFRLHRLLAHFVRGVGSDPGARPAVEDVLIASGRLAHERGLAGLPLLALTPHLAHVTDLALQRGEDARAAALCDALGRVLNLGCDFAGARSYLERALKIRERVLGPDHPDTASSLDGMAALLWDCGELSAGQALQERALAIRHRVPGPPNPDTASGMTRLGLILQARGEMAAARPLLERALVITESVMGPHHPQAAAAMGNLAVLLRDQGDLFAARPLLEAALAVRESTLGPDDPETASSLNDLALLLGDLGESALAQPLHERALAIRERVLGPDHPRTAQSLNNLARVLRDQGRLAAARPLLERALAIWEAAMGPDHLLTAHGLTNLGRLLADVGDLTAARSMQERALDIRERVLGPDNSRTAQSMINLAALLQAQGELTTARALFERALDIQQRVLGPDHPLTALGHSSLGLLLRDQGELGAARTHLACALAIRERALGPDHPDTALTRAALNDLYARDRPA